MYVWFNQREILNIDHPAQNHPLNCATPVNTVHFTIKYVNGTDCTAYRSMIVICYPYMRLCTVFLNANLKRMNRWKIARNPTGTDGCWHWTEFGDRRRPGAQLPAAQWREWVRAARERVDWAKSQTVDAAMTVAVFVYVHCRTDDKGWGGFRTE